MQAARQGRSGGRREESLTRVTVITAAMQLADRDGLEAVTIRRLAAQLGVTPMALYKHVRDKGELLAALRERMLSEIELPPRAGAASWDQELIDVLLATVPALRRHPAIAPLALHGLFDGEAGLELCERMLALLSEAGFAPQDAIGLSAFVSGSVVSLVTMLPTEGDLSGGRPPEDPSFAELDSERFPTLNRLAGTTASLTDDAYVTQCVELLVHGLQTLAPSART